MALILFSSLAAGAVVTFFTSWPFCKEVFMKDVYEGQSVPWWYGETVRFKAGSVTMIMMPFHMLVRWGWRFYVWIQWNTKDFPDSIRIEHLEMRCKYLSRELDVMIKNRDEAILRCWELEEQTKVDRHA